MPSSTEITPLVPTQAGEAISFLDVILVIVGMKRNLRGEFSSDGKSQTLTAYSMLVAL